MAEVLKIFIGSNGKAFDSVELMRLGKVAENEGFQLFYNATAMVREISKIEDNYGVILRGGWADACISAAADYCLQRGITVTCDLPNIRTSNGKGNRKEQIVRRMSEDSNKIKFIY